MSLPSRISKRETAFFVPTNIHSYRKYKPGRIIGVEFITPMGLGPRLCYHVKWEDNEEDWFPVGTNDYKLVTFDQIVNGEIPKEH